MNLQGRKFLLGCVILENDLFSKVSYYQNKKCWENEVYFSIALRFVTLSSTCWYAWDCYPEGKT
jgi:hypothetical protein